ncbi:uncharacterized protein LOC105425252 [Pogonomyrmex barbatus]|uniref:Odorant receptor n=1 Tax=Pogonomyrmex barbatus TaxID=144034 RepID=A0A8N1S4C8_9HYME|nr:uncharacterized protein LOC105425252 [Pogonomyrmex barbatus]
MSSPETQYCTFNKFQFLAIGLWPYQQSEFARFQFIFFCVILLTSVIFQLQHTHNEIKDENEIVIIEKYDCIARRYTNSFTTFAVCGIIFGLTLNVWLLINIDVPINTTQLYQFPIIMEYFFDHEMYFYFSLLHVNAAVCIGATALLAIGSLMITYIIHVCGMFKIASYRIENAMDINILQNITMENDIFMYDGIICAVKIHRQALKLSKNLQSAVQVMIFCLVVCGVTSLSLNLYQIFQIASFKNDVQELLLSSLFVFVIVLYMFIANYIGQKALEHNNHIFATAYNVQWYKAPLHVQKMILFLLQKGVKEHTLNLGGLLHGSMECFATLLKTSVSYFTVIHSMQ